LLSDISTLSNTKCWTISAPYGDLAAVIHTPGRVANSEVLIICHGFRGSKDGGGRAIALAKKAAAMGFTVVRFDFSPQGSLTRQIEELTAVVAYCRSHISLRVILLGRSMGGSAALAFAAADQEIAGLCLWATPCNLTETFRLALGAGYDRLVAGLPLMCEDEYGPLCLAPDFIEDFANYDFAACAASLVGVPLLIVHGSEDQIVPLDQAEQLYAAARQPKDFVVIPGGDHQFVNSHQVASGAVLSWLARMFPEDGI
jgi:pimeloyl-ACP methyl ester carboxylesterase